MFATRTAQRGHTVTFPAMPGIPPVRRRSFHCSGNVRLKKNIGPGMGRCNQCNEWYVIKDENVSFSAYFIHIIPAETHQIFKCVLSACCLAVRIGRRDRAEHNVVRRRKNRSTDGTSATGICPGPDPTRQSISIGTRRSFESHRSSALVSSCRRPGKSHGAS